MGETEIRPPTDIDLPGLVASSVALFAEDAGTRDPTVDIEWPQKHGAESFGAIIGEPARLVLVADADGAIVGHLTGALDEPLAIRPVRVATLNSMYVRSTHRGAGVGARLVASFRAGCASRVWTGSRSPHMPATTARSGSTNARASRPCRWSWRGLPNGCAIRCG
jgi:GNAT superfamily N-acetyltransferase